jgi:hypothetical protein
MAYMKIANGAIIIMNKILNYNQEYYLSLGNKATNPIIHANNSCVIFLCNVLSSIKRIYIDFCSEFKYG